MSGPALHAGSHLPRATRPSAPDPERPEVEEMDRHGVWGVWTCRPCPATAPLTHAVLLFGQSMARPRRVTRPQTGCPSASGGGSGSSGEARASTSGRRT